MSFLAVFARQYAPSFVSFDLACGAQAGRSYWKDQGTWAEEGLCVYRYQNMEGIGK